VVAGRWRGVPLASPEAWLAAYDLLERPAKRDLLRDHLRARGHDARVVATLQAEPLPAKLAGLLASLGEEPRRAAAPPSSTT
jgi:hypothetical protein